MPSVDNSQQKAFPSGEGFLRTFMRKKNEQICVLEKIKKNCNINYKNTLDFIVQKEYNVLVNTIQKEMKRGEKINHTERR